MEIKRITQLIHNAYQSYSWHGPNIQSVLQTVSPGHILHRIEDSHNIAEIVSHMIAWRRFAIEKLQGNTEYDVTEQANWLIINEMNKQEWQQLLVTFQESQDALEAAIHQQSDQLLEQTVGLRRYNYYILLHGIIQHDLYHLGQIVLLNK